MGYRGKSANPSYKTVRQSGLHGGRSSAAPAWRAAVREVVADVVASDALSSHPARRTIDAAAAAVARMPEVLRRMGGSKATSEAKVTALGRGGARKAEYRTRTDDPFLTMEVLYQLS
jgi:hypothetical protein